MLHAGLDLSRKRIDIYLLSESGEHLDQLAAPPDADRTGCPGGGHRHRFAKG
jgi:hypothetical protein